MGQTLPTFVTQITRDAAALQGTIALAVLAIQQRRPALPPPVRLLPPKRFSLLRRPLRSAARALGVSLIAGFAVTCADGSTAPEPAAATLARIALAPAFSAEASQVAAQLDDFGIAYDRVHIVLRRVGQQAALPLGVIPLP